ncbi:hypothetical protein EU527_16950 [Candidatus Thorarchaeota archaeon]|nr:MAG: hypothetical protein EU527_16950 [Candidatus Thorarchaeota archaeon]
MQSYPHYFRTSFVVEEHPNLHAYLRVQFRCQGLSSIEGVWFSYMIFTGDVSVLDSYRDPNNSTVLWEMSEDGLSLRYGSSTNLEIQSSSDEILDFIVEPGEYVWVHFMESAEEVNVSAVSVTLSILYK